MAVNPIQFIVAQNASVTDGTKTINITGNVDCSSVFAGTAVFIGGADNPAEAVSGTAPDSSGNSTITLRNNWTQGDQLNQQLVSFNTNEGLAEAISNVREIVSNVSAIETLTTKGLVKRISDNVYEVVNISTIGEELITATDASSQRAVLGLGDVSTKNVGILEGDILEVSTGGNVGIGTTTPSRTLEVSTADNLPILARSTDPLSIIGMADSTSSSGIGNLGGDLLLYTDGISAGGNFTEKVRVKGNGNVGVGSTNPSGKLEVNVGNSTGALFTRTAGDNGTSAAAFGIQTTTTTTRLGNSGDLAFRVGAVGTPTNNQAERMRITAIGNVGIGTSSPSYPLEVSASTSAIKTTNSASTDQSIVMGDPVTLANSVGIYGRTTGAFSFMHSGGYFQWKNTSSTEFMRLTASGDLGIGTNSPSALLDVQRQTLALSSLFSTGDYAATFSGQGGDTTGTAQGILLSGDSGELRGVAIAAESQNSSNAHDMVFATSSSAAVPSERMRITSGGQVGIGTDNPLGVLDVANGLSGRTDLASGYNDFHIQGNNSTGMTISSPNSQNCGIAFADAGSNFRGGMTYVHSLDEMRLYTSGVERLTIESSGRLLSNNNEVYHEGNTNFNEFGGTGTSDLLSPTIGYAESATQISFLLPINSKTLPTSISITGGFRLYNIDTGTYESVVNSPQLITSLSSNRTAYIIFSGLSGKVRGHKYVLASSTTTTGKITVNF